MDELIMSILCPLENNTPPLPRKKNGIRKQHKLVIAKAKKIRNAILNNYHQDKLEQSSHSNKICDDIYVSHILPKDTECVVVDKLTNSSQVIEAMRKGSYFIRRAVLYLRMDGVIIDAPLLVRSDKLSLLNLNDNDVSFKANSPHRIQWKYIPLIISSSIKGWDLLHAYALNTILAMYTGWSTNSFIYAKKGPRLTIITLTNLTIKRENDRYVSAVLNNRDANLDTINLHPTILSQSKWRHQLMREGYRRKDCRLLPMGDTMHNMTLAKPLPDTYLNTVKHAHNLVLGTRKNLDKVAALVKDKCWVSCLMCGTLTSNFIYCYAYAIRYADGQREYRVCDQDSGLQDFHSKFIEECKSAIIWPDRHTDIPEELTDVRKFYLDNAVTWPGCYSYELYPVYYTTVKAGQWPEEKESNTDQEMGWKLMYLNDSEQIVEIKDRLDSLLDKMIEVFKELPDNDDVCSFCRIKTDSYDHVVGRVKDDGTLEPWEEELVHCPFCCHVWDGYAQCSCNKTD
jgi:hypothetical protein